MLAGLGKCGPAEPREDALEQLCGIGVAYGWRELERTTNSALLEGTSAEAQAHLRQHLQRTLEWITRPSFDLEWSSFTLALEALRLTLPGAPATTEKFLGKEPIDRLSSFFNKFPALAGLWSIAISQWRDYAAEILVRAVADEGAIARAFFDGKSVGGIRDLKLGLSDRHNNGRSVALVTFESGRVIYKPRSGTSEAAWDSFQGLMNENGFRPPLKNARVLRRRNYHWMEYIAPGSCADAAAAGRFYRRLGGLIAAAYLLNAVDCHRENLIAAGEYPVLVDVDALWHVSSVTTTQSATDLLYRTGFFPNSNPESLQSRSSALGKPATGTHLAHIDGRPELPADYAEQIVAGFAAGRRSLVGTSTRRASFLQRLRRIRSEERRWIYLATEKYAAIIRASIQPGALSSATTRADLIRGLCARPSASLSVLRAEIAALERLDVPYFTRKSSERMPAVTSSLPGELSEAIRNALEWSR